MQMKSHIEYYQTEGYNDELSKIYLYYKHHKMNSNQDPSILRRLSEDIYFLVAIEVRIRNILSSVV